MAMFLFNGVEVPLISTIDDLELGDAEVMEEAFGIDMRDLNKLPLTKQLSVFILMSVRRQFPAATVQDVKRVKLGPLIAAFETAGAASDSREPQHVEFTGELQVAAGLDDAVEDGVVLSPTNAGSGPSSGPVSAIPAGE